MINYFFVDNLIQKGLNRYILEIALSLSVFLSLSLCVNLAGALGEPLSGKLKYLLNHIKGTPSEHTLTFFRPLHSEKVSGSICALSLCVIIKTNNYNEKLWSTRTCMFHSQNLIGPNAYELHVPAIFNY